MYLQILFGFFVRGVVAEFLQHRGGIVSEARFSHLHLPDTVRWTAWTKIPKFQSEPGRIQKRKDHTNKQGCTSSNYKHIFSQKDVLEEKENLLNQNYDILTEEVISKCTIIGRFWYFWSRSRNREFRIFLSFTWGSISRIVLKWTLCPCNRASIFWCILFI